MRLLGLRCERLEHCRLYKRKRPSLEMQVQPHYSFCCPHGRSLLFREWEESGVVLFVMGGVFSFVCLFSFVFTCSLTYKTRMTIKGLGHSALARRVLS